MTTEQQPEYIDMGSSIGTSVIRWEAASGLEHTCFACPTKANHPKARQSCYGIHSIPCYRYHPTMHAIGTSHNCFACIQADNQHHERHRKILELKAEYLALGEAEANASVKNKKGRGPALHERDANAPINYGNHGPHHGPLANGGDDEQENDLDAPEVADTASISAPSTTSSGATTASTASKTPKPTKADIRAAKREAKEAKSRRKSLKNQNKYTGLVIRADEIEDVAQILHGDSNTDESHPLASDKCIEDVMERNRRYVTSINEHKAMLLKEVGRSRRVEREKERDRIRNARKRKDRDSLSGGSGQRANESLVMDDEQEALVNAVLIRMGLPEAVTGDGGAGGTTPATPFMPKRASSVAGKSSQERSMVLAQLRVAISDDLIKHENEQRQTCIRAGGFWRYVGRPVFDRMMEIAGRIDWKTGMLIRSKKMLEEMADDNAAEPVVDPDVENNDANDAAPRDAVENVREWVDVVADPAEAGEAHEHPV